MFLFLQPGFEFNFQERRISSLGIVNLLYFAYILSKNNLMKIKSTLIHEKIKSAYIRKHPVFDQLDEAQFVQICTKAKLVKLKRNTPFMLNNDPAGRVFFLTGGTAKLVSLDPSGDNSVKNILVDNDIFGDVSFEGLHMDGYVAGLRPNTHMFYFAAAELKKILQDNHRMLLNYAEAIGQKLRTLEERHTVWTTKDARLRLQYFFRGWAFCDGTKTDNGVILENYFILNDIAEFIGVSRQFMHTMLKELKEEGLVHYSRKQIEVADSFLKQDRGSKKQVV